MTPAENLRKRPPILTRADDITPLELPRYREPEEPRWSFWVTVACAIGSLICIGLSALLAGRGFGP